MAGTMKNTINKLVKENMKAAKKYADFEDVLFAGKQQYHNTAVEAANAEVYALRFALDEAYTRIDEQQKQIVELYKEVNELKMMLMRNMQKASFQDEEYKVVREDKPKSGRQPKWTKEKIFREWDLYRREHALFSNITPEIVRNNWSTLYTQCPKYTGMTLGQLLKEYAGERNINYV